MMTYFSQSRVYLMILDHFVEDVNQVKFLCSLGEQPAELLVIELQNRSKSAILSIMSGEAIAKHLIGLASAQLATYFFSERSLSCQKQT
mmetsp:Transcript_6676/g.13375  ORF Transcript_6676/g.13375 Transcript_6676/m.13375 type:complete len:89 (-) Transcript_6676:88-354(-)